MIARAFFACCAVASAASLLPAPQRVNLTARNFTFGPAWSVRTKDVRAAASLTEGLQSRFHLGAPTAGTVIALSIVRQAPNQPNADQAYRLHLAPDGIAITASAPAGLFYGVQTLLQLITPRPDGTLQLPEGEIEDWPDLALREIYWDDAHHLDRPETLRAAIAQAAFYKINGFVLKLEGHFQYRSAPAIVEPYAMSPAELQSLTDYARARHVYLIPYLDGPAHVAFILKHPEYAALREFPDSNYEGCAVNPAFYKFLTGMYRDLLDANRGVPYFYLSTDEAYYIGKSANPACDEAARAKQLGSPGKLLAEFLDKAAGWLHQHGRTVMFWGEFPLKADDIASLPPWLVNGETYGPQFDPLFAKRGIRSMIYTSTQGEERHFPEYSILSNERRVHPRRAAGVPRVESVAQKIATDPARQSANVIGAIVAGWADSGLHPETFWLGYAAGTAAAWNSAAPVAESTAAFYRLFYGPHAERIDRLYDLMSWQAQFWTDSWETGPSQSRKPIWGNSNTIFDPKRPAQDQFLPPEIGESRLKLVSAALAENDELLKLLDANLSRADFNRYNLEVFRTLAHLFRHNLQLIAALGRTPKLSHAEARAALLREIEDVWYKSWYPRVESANGRKFLHEFDDVKDHPADRTVDLSYLIERELRLPLP